MEEVIDFNEERRKKFRESIKVPDGREISNIQLAQASRVPERVSPLHERISVGGESPEKRRSRIAREESRFRRAWDRLTPEQQKKIEREYAINKDRFGLGEAEKRRKKRVLNSKPSSIKGRFTGKILAVPAVVLALAIGAGGISIANNTIKNNEPITIEQALNAGITTDMLQIDDNTLQEIEEIEAKLSNENISPKELKTVLDQLIDLQFDVTKSKLGDVLGVDQSDITVKPHPASESEVEDATVRVEKDSGDEIYHKAGFWNNKNAISPQIADMIFGIQRNQINSGNLEDIIKEDKTNDNNSEDRTEDLEDIRKAALEECEDLKEFAAMRMEIDENGNIGMVEITRGEAEQAGDNLDKELIGKTYSEYPNSNLNQNKNDQEQDEER